MSEHTKQITANIHANIQCVFNIWDMNKKEWTWLTLFEITHFQTAFTEFSNNKFEFSHVLSSEVNQAALRKAARPRSWNMNNLISDNDN